MNQVIIDTDPGVDDALAIMMACKSNLSIAGITTVYGNSGVNNTTRNALMILQLLEKDIPVYKGAAFPIKGESVSAQSHGTNGLGGLDVSTLNKKAQGKAIAFYRKVLESNKEKSVDIIAIGPLTNLALLGEKYPNLINKIRKLIILAGVFNEKGNINPYAEFNSYNDPYALQLVLGFDCEKILIPANVCRKVMLTLEDFKRIDNKQLQNSVNTITEMYINYYKNDPIYGGFKGGVMYDLLAVCYELESTIFQVESVYVQVTPIDKQERGMTTVRTDNKPNCKIVTIVDLAKIKKLFFGIMNY